MKLISQRFSKNFTVLVGCAICLFGLTAFRLRNGALLPPTMFPGSPAAFPPDAADYPNELANGKSPAVDISFDRPDLPAGQCTRELDFLRRPELELSDKVVYTRRCVKPIWGGANRNVVTNISNPLITHKTVVSLASCAAAEPVPCDPLPLQVPYAYPDKSFSHLIFGVATKYDRLNESLPAFAHWLSGTGALLVGIVGDAEDPQRNYNLTALEEEFSSWEVRAVFVAPKFKQKINVPSDQEIPIEHHHFMMIRDLLEYSTPQTQWLGVLDDDTFFPSLYPLDEELNKYDSSKPQWLGALSDDFGSVRTWGFMAFGGAGTFLSTPLAREIEPYLEECIADATTTTGDGMLRDCMYQRTRTKLTLVEGLYQHDIRGDAAGFYESGVRPLSVHHWKSWYSDPIPKMASVTGLCGDCFLQRFRFGDDTVLSNGYSIAQYNVEGGLDNLDLDRVEGTWGPADPNDNDWSQSYAFSYGTLRPKLTMLEKKSYRLRDVEVTDEGHFRQVYVFKATDWQPSAMDEVIELLWDSS